MILCDTTDNCNVANGSTPWSVKFLYLWTIINIGRPQDIFLQLQVVYPGKIAAAFAIGSFLLSTRSRHAGRPPAIWGLPEFRLIGAFVAIAIISTPFGYYPKISVEFLLDFLLRFGLYLFLVSRLITTRERLFGLLRTITISGCLMAVAIIFAHQEGRRAHVGTTYDPNDLAMLMVTILPIAITLTLMESRRIVKNFYFLSALMILVAITFTQSRGGFVGLIIVSLTFFFCRVPGISTGKRVFLGIVLATIFVVSMSEQYRERIATIIDNQDQGSGRTFIWKRAFVLVQDHPMLGVGPNAFMTAYGDYLANDRFTGDISVQKAGERWQTAHNAYILVATELGLVGFVIFIAINIRTFHNLYHVAYMSRAPTDTSDTGGLQLVAVGMALGLLGFLTCAFFLSQAYNGLIYVFCILSGLMRRLNTDSEFFESKTLAARETR